MVRLLCDREVAKGNFSQNCTLNAPIDYAGEDLTQLSLPSPREPHIDIRSDRPGPEWTPNSPSRTPQVQGTRTTGRPEEGESGSVEGPGRRWGGVPSLRRPSYHIVETWIDTDSGGDRNPLSLLGRGPRPGALPGAGRGYVTSVGRHRSCPRSGGGWSSVSTVGGPDRDPPLRTRDVTVRDADKSRQDP